MGGTTGWGEGAAHVTRGVSGGLARGTDNRECWDLVRNFAMDKVKVDSGRTSYRE